MASRGWKGLIQIKYVRHNHLEICTIVCGVVILDRINNNSSVISVKKKKLIKFQDGGSNKSRTKYGGTNIRC